MEYEGKKRRTRREVFLERMDGLIRWERLEARIRPFYPRAGRGRRPYPLSVMLRVHCVQLFYDMSDPGMEDMLYEVESVRRFAGRRLSGPIPDETLFALDTDLWVPRQPGFLDWSTTIARRRIAFCGGGETAAYLTQAVQSRTHPVPLVAGEQALLRVFLTATTTTTEELPPVRARFYVDGTEPHVAEISAKSTSIPAEVFEGDLSKSQNAEIPGEIVQPGLEMVIEVDPDGTLDPGLGVPGRIPEEGRLALDVRRMPPLELTVIPFLAPSRPDSAVVDAAAGMAADPEGHELLEHTRILLPVGALGVTAHEPVVSTSVNTWDLAGQIGTIRAIEGERGHHVGLIGEGFDGPAYGWIGGRLSVSSLNSQILAHELGHNMHLYHAPCGGAGGPDPSFPVPNGSIGAYGYDFRTGEVVARSRADLMSYCNPRWISDYHFSNALGYRLLDEGGASSSVASAPTRSLLVWGGVDPDGEAFLNPAFVVDAPVALPDSAGAYAVTGRDAGDGAGRGGRGAVLAVVRDAGAGGRGGCVVLRVRGSGGGGVGGAAGVGHALGAGRRGGARRGDEPADGDPARPGERTGSWLRQRTPPGCAHGRRRRGRHRRATGPARPLQPRHPGRGGVAALRPDARGSLEAPPGGRLTQTLTARRP